MPRMIPDTVDTTSAKIITGILLPKARIITSNTGVLNQIE